MRVTYAVYLEISLDGLQPGLWEEISKCAFSKNLDRGSFRHRIEITRLEYDGVTEENRCGVRQVVERAGRSLGLARFRQMVGDARLEPAAFASLCHVSCVEVPGAPNPSECHSMEGENPSVLCPSCHSPMVHRQGLRGVFWACRKFPACKGTRNISK